MKSNLEKWKLIKLGDCLVIKHGKSQTKIEISDGVYPILATSGIIGRTNTALYSEPSVLIGRKGTIDRPQYMETPFWTVDTLFYSQIKDIALARFIYYKFLTINWKKYNEGSGIPSLSASTISSIKLNLPSLPEQNRIVAVLDIWDEAIEKLSRKIEIKKKIKRSLMQKLLTGVVRLPGFAEEWHTVELRDIAICLDNKRKPINSEERRTRKGDIPYCGANGIVDYIDDYIFDEKIILIAEDGGQFNDFLYRPIAYRMNCKCWVNNHAHVIKTKGIFSQDLLFYLTVHKDILKYLSGGTRAKLNQSELMRIKYYVPKENNEQAAIANILTTADDEIDALKKELSLLKEQKKYLLNNLITGAIRTPENLSIRNK